MRKYSISNINFLFIILYFALQFLSPLTSYDYFYIEVISVVILIVILRGKLSLSSFIWIIFYAIIVAIYIFSPDVDITSSYFSPRRFLVRFIGFVIVSLLIDVFAKLKNDEKRKLIILICICSVITNMISFFYLRYDRYAIRYRTEMVNEKFGTGYAGIIKFSQIFAFEIFAGIIFLMLLWIHKEKIRKKNLIFWEVVLGINVALIFLSQLATPMLLLFICLFLSLLFCNYSEKNKLIKLLICGITIILLLLFKNVILISLIGVIGKINNSKVTERILAILTMLYGDSSLGPLANRTAKIERSLASFSLSPLFGIGFSNYSELTVGCHQDWFDMLATLGIIGISIIGVNCFYRIFKIYNEAKYDVDKVSFLFAAIYFVLLGFLDLNMDTSIQMMVFLVAPNISKIMYMDQRDSG